MKKHTSVSLKVLKFILATYIILCILIAGVKYGYAPSASIAFQEWITWFWLFYENWIKTAFIIICSILTLKVISESKQRSTMRKRNLIGFIIISLLVHIILPICLHNKELYVFNMPFPWTTFPLQTLYEAKSSIEDQGLVFSLWGIPGVTSVILFYLFMNALVFIGTLLFGRRLQCSTLCLFNGFASEVFGIGMPLVGKKKTVGPKLLKVLTIIKWVFFVITMYFGLWWICKLDGISLFGEMTLISKLESIKYLSLELLMALFFWVAVFDRAYCYYCPLGTILGLLGKVAGQKISSGHTRCVECNRCNIACPMSIDLKTNASQGLPIQNMRCVGCGHCIDTCPTKNLKYSTNFLEQITKHASNQDSSINP